MPESHSLWNLADGEKVLFVALPHEPASAARKLQEIFQ